MWESVYMASWAELKFSFASNINWCSVIGDTGAELGDHPSLMSMGYVQGRVGLCSLMFPTVQWYVILWQWKLLDSDNGDIIRNVDSFKLS